MNGACVPSAATPSPASGRDKQSVIVIGCYLLTTHIRPRLLAIVRRFILH